MRAGKAEMKWTSFDREVPVAAGELNGRCVVLCPAFGTDTMHLCDRMSTPGHADGWRAFAARCGATQWAYVDPPTVSRIKALERKDIDYVRLYRSHENGKWHAKNGAGDYMHSGCFDTAAECVAHVMRPKKMPKEFA